MCHRRIGRELQHHDNILLHLLREHQWGLQEKILFRAPGWRTGNRGAMQRPRQNQRWRKAAPDGESKRRQKAEEKRTKRKLEAE